ncbi:uncharacterized protein VTP21DRAFT_1168 [Calcarisporiella thermophila]|uniref:uncharacterized protein n=1 Tax=Calcarisporiella thermophila TaxID=911321 RepID=UPI003743477F
MEFHDSANAKKMNQNEDYNDDTLVADFISLHMDDAFQLKSRYESLLHTTRSIASRRGRHLTHLNPKADITSSPRHLLHKRTMDFQQIQLLEGEKGELSEELEQMKRKHREQSTHYKRRVDELERQLEWLQECIENERSRAEVFSHKLSDENEDRGGKELEEYKWVIDELSKKCDQLEAEKARLSSENHRLAHAKSELTAHITAIIQDFERLSEEYHTIQFNRADYERLKEAYARQTELVNTLEIQVEGYREQVYEALPSPCNTVSSVATSSWNDSSDLIPQPTLLEELQKEFFKNTEHEKKLKTLAELGETVFDSVVDGMLECACFLARRRNRAGEFKARIRRGSLGLLLRVMRRIFRSLFRWCVHICILILILVKELIEGPL